MAACIRCVSAAAKTQLLTTFFQTSCCRIQVASYAKKFGGKMASQQVQKVRLDVETDPDKLTKYCCGANINIDGKDPEIKPDSEYPDWLWTLRTERGALDLSEIEYDTHQYWKRLRKLNIKRRNRLQSVERLK